MQRIYIKLLFKKIFYLKLIVEYPIWFFAICLLVGLLYAYLLYGRKAFIFFAEEKKSLRYILATLRFLAVSLICFLLLSPLIKTTQTEEQKPTIVLLQDNSASLKKALGTQSANYFSKIKELQQKLEKKYNVIYRQFGEKLKNTENLDFSEQVTDIDNALKQTYLQYDHLNIGAIILASDGIFNMGNNPIYNSFVQKSSIYSIALGDTTEQKDVFIKNLLYPDIVYLGDNFNLQIDIEAHLLNGSNTVIEITDKNGNIVFKKAIVINQVNFSTTEQIILNADKPEVLKYKVSLKTVSGEVIKENNISIAYVDVIDGRQKILLLYDAPHPDVKAFKYAIEANKNYQIEVESAANFNKSITNYDMVILHGLPSSVSSFSNDLVQNIVNSKKPLLFILSAQTNLYTFNNLQKLVKITGSSSNGNDVFPIQQADFSKFIMDEQAVNILKQFSPILAPYGKYETSSNADILFKQQIGKVPTNNPLVLFADEQDRKVGIFTGEGWWRWRLNEFMQFKNTAATDNLISKTIQFLTVKNDKRKFKINSTKRIYGANEAIVFEAHLYNESYILVNEPDVNIELESKDKKYNFVFDKTLNAYTLNAGILPIGDYIASAKTNYKGQVYKANVDFSIAPINLELQNLQANWNLLNTLSNQSGGKVFYENNLLNIADAIHANKNIQSILFENTQTQPLIDWKIIFGIILLLLSAEWIIRKYNGIA